MTNPAEPLSPATGRGGAPLPSDPGGSTSRRSVLATMLAASAAAALGPGVLAPSRAAAATRPLQSARFDVAVDEATGGVFRLVDPQDPYRTNYLLNPDNRPNFVVDDSRWLGDMVFSVKGAGDSAPRPAVTGLSDDVRTVTSDADGVTVRYAGTAANRFGIRGFTLTQQYALTGPDRSRLSWTFTVTNTSGAPLEFLDVGLPLPMDSWWASDQTAIYEQNVSRHSFVAEDGSYLYWQRPNGEAPYLVMVPQEGTRLEFKNKARFKEGPFAEKDPAWEGLVEYYVHSKDIQVARAASTAAYLPATSLVLAPGASKTYGFTFRWAGSYHDLRDVLFDAGVVDVVSLPGMVVPTDLTATLAVRAAGGITSVVGEAGKGIAVRAQGTRNGYSLYQLTMPTLGANDVTVTYAGNRTSVLQYWAIEPVEKVIAARTAFLAGKQQARTARGYDGAYLQWDMSRQRLITWDDYPGGGWKQWMAGGSDDLGLGPAAFLARKNVSDPVPSEIASVDRFIQRFLHGYLQARTENGQRTYQVYRWFDGRDGTPQDQGVWRAYNYAHIANTYFHMYEVATTWPDLKTAFGALDYLDMAFRTWEAMYTKIPLPTPIGDAAHDLGLMGEGTYPELLAALRFEGRTAQAATLQGFLDAKAKRLFAQKYPFASEASIDTTGFEANYTLAKAYGNTELARKVQRASLACRGLQPLWYFYGSDNRHMGESWWNLGYETQIGAWQQQDYLRNYAAPDDPDFDDMVRSTYGAYLAGWANVNSGQISPAEANRGAASWQFQSEKGRANYDWIPILDGWWAWSGEADLGFWGGVRTASTTVVEDRAVGTYAYGGEVRTTGAGGEYAVVPRDGVRQRLIVHPARGLTVEVSRAKYSRATVSRAADRVGLTVQGVGGAASAPRIGLANLAAGTYDVSVGGSAVSAQLTSDGRGAAVALGSTASDAAVLVSRTGNAPGEREVGRDGVVSATYTASWNRVGALNDGLVAAGGATDQTALWGTYRRTGRSASDTLTCTWGEPVTVASSTLVFWADAARGSGDGVALPDSWRLEFRDASGSWQPVQPTGAAAYPVNPAGARSTVTFSPVSTTALRAVLTASAAAGGSRSAVAVSEWSVFTPAPAQPVPPTQTRLYQQVNSGNPVRANVGQPVQVVVQFGNRGAGVVDGNTLVETCRQTNAGAAGATTFSLAPAEGTQQQIARPYPAGQNANLTLVGTPTSPGRAVFECTLSGQDQAGAPVSATTTVTVDVVR
ncbi:DUF5695 domain-containing protein [Kineococcus sp. TBRC 1896]|uniref:DUF5695 domain-containing protein n=1 Tax=Kineococcus mangrovi TaxID=1660183 RepID=A0ABV4HYP6_9ACTN